MSHTDNIKKLISITDNVFNLQPSASEELIAFINRTDSSDPLVSQLAENISMLTVQKDVYALRLENMIEDFLLAQKKIDEAKHDPLTGLPNRALFHSFLEEKCLTCSRTEPVGLLFIDLDKFKNINDTMGHDAGDEILKSAAQRMERNLKKEDILCRMGGDEFTIILSGFSSSSQVEKIAGRIIAQLCKPFKLNNGIGLIGASIGISFCPMDAEAPVSLIKNADIAMYKAKANGRNRYELFSSRYA